MGDAGNHPPHAGQLFVLVQLAFQALGFFHALEQNTVGAFDKKPQQREQQHGGREGGGDNQPLETDNYPVIFGDILGKLQHVQGGAVVFKGQQTGFQTQRECGAQGEAARRQMKGEQGPPEGNFGLNGIAGHVRKPDPGHFRRSQALGANEVGVQGIGDGRVVGVNAQIINAQTVQQGRNDLVQGLETGGLIQQGKSPAANNQGQGVTLVNLMVQVFGHKQGVVFLALQQRVPGGIGDNHRNGQAGEQDQAHGDPGQQAGEA